MKLPEPKKTKTGDYAIQLRLSGQSIYIHGRTPKECRDQARLYKSEYLAGIRTVRTSGLTITGAIDNYIKKREHTLSPSTITGYRRIQAGRFKDTLPLPLDAKIDWQSVCDREARLCSPKTLKNAYMFICSVLRENDIRPPAVTLPVQEKHTRPWLDPDQIRQLVASVHGEREEFPVLFALHSLRRSEILALDWSNIDLENRCFTVRGAVVKNINGEFVLKDANKNLSSQRTLPIMIPELYEALSAVTDRTGRVVKVSGNIILRQVNKACARAHVPEVGTHGLRHSFASLAYHLGLSELETMELGGWSDAKTMRGIYTHLSQKDRLKAQNRITDFFQNAHKNA